MLEMVKLIWPFTNIIFRLKITLLFTFALATSFLDAIALYLFARVFSSIAQKDNSFIQDLFFTIKISPFSSINTMYAFVIALVLILFAVKSLATILLSRKTLRVLSDYYSDVSQRFVHSYFQMQLNEIKSRPNYEIFMSVNTGIKDIFVTGIYSYINLLVEILVLCVLLAFVLLQGGFPVIMLMVFFFITFLISNNFSSATTQFNSQKASEANLAGAIAIQTLTESIREIKLFGSLNHFTPAIQLFACEVTQLCRRHRLNGCSCIVCFSLGFWRSQSRS
jgi:hypothetical protein